MLEPPAFARIPLARSLPRLLVLPLVALVAGGLAVAAGLVLLDGGIALALTIGGGVAIALALTLAVALLSMRVELTDAGLRIGSIFGSRHHVLVTGPVTRLAIAGPDAVPLRSTFGGRAWAYGRARLRDREPIWVVRLAPVNALVVIPTDRGRLAVAPRSERELLEGLAEVGRRQEAARVAEVPMVAEPASEPATAPPAPDPVPRLLTGIERSIVWDLLEAARIDEEAAAARAAADAEAREAEAVSPEPEVDPAPAHGATERAERRRWTLLRRRAAPPPAQEAALDLAAAVPTGEVELQPPTPEPMPMLAPVGAAQPSVASVPTRPARRRRRSRLRRRIDRLFSLPPAARLAGIGVIALPLALVAAVWFAADRVGTLPETMVGLRSVALAVLLAGPITALGAIIARAAAPRLVGLVVMSAMVAIFITVRALMP